jgi:transposase
MAFKASTLDRMDHQVAKLVAGFDHFVQVFDAKRRFGGPSIYFHGCFPGAAQVSSWAGMCPVNHENAGKRRSGRMRERTTSLM